MDIFADFLAAAVGFLDTEPAVMREGWLTVLVGHGSEYGSEWIYDGFREVCREAGYRDLFAAALEGSPDLGDLLPVLRASGCRNITLVPLLFMAGVHAVRDISGNIPESRKSRLEAEGFTVDAVVRGLGEYKEIRRRPLNRDVRWR